MQAPSEQTSAAHKTATTVCYMLCSSLMLMTNKLSVTFLPKPGLVLLLQFLTSALFAKLIGLFDFSPVDKLEMPKVKKFGVVAIAQVATIFSGTKALQHSNVETCIVFRASMPIVLSVVDYLFLGRTLPNKRSSLCLFAMIVGACLYVLTDSAFEVHGYLWIAVWYAAFVFDFAYIKYIVSTVPMTTFGRVYYQNTLGSVLFFAISMASGELSELRIQEWPVQTWGALSVGCVLGMGMSVFSYLLRAMVSSTQMAIIGNVCKVITVFINFMIWEKHATAAGLGALCICLVAAYFYQQAPLAEVATTKVTKVVVKSTDDTTEEKEIEMTSVELGVDLEKGDATRRR